MRFIKFFILFLLCFSYTNGFAQAEITFESEVVDYGTNEKGDDGVREFKFTNTGIPFVHY